MRCFKHGTYDHTAAIEHWLELNAQGWMDFGYGYSTKMAEELTAMLATEPTR